MRSGQSPRIREIVLYVPVGGHPATARIPRGSAIVAEPKLEYSPSSTTE
ncbi:MAG: hypothetical protein JJE35_14300 [Thermoleophilia bacterium]|nr:hypothetical protein [Thermoleophilia bacterium]